jgi:16S rRNA processing protein RimM
LTWRPVGRVVAPHGVRGELRVRLYSEEFPLCGAVRVGEQMFDVARARATPKGLLLALCGCEHRDVAETLRGAEVCADVEDAPAGSYYLADLLGADFVDDHGTLLGRGKAFLQGATVVALEGPDGERLLPVSEQTIVRVDRAAKRVVAKVPAGLWDP